MECNPPPLHTHTQTHSLQAIPPILDLFLRLQYRLVLRGRRNYLLGGNAPAEVHPEHSAMQTRETASGYLFHGVDEAVEGALRQRVHEEEVGERLVVPTAGAPLANELAGPRL